MSDLTLEYPTCHSMEDLRPLLDAALAQQFPSGMLQRRWEGDVLHVWGPGAKGTVSVEGGRLVGRAALSPPASLMKGFIQEKISKALEAAAS